MADSGQLGYWLFVACALLIAPIVLMRVFARISVEDFLDNLWDWMAARADTDPDLPDPDDDADLLLPAEVRRINRTEKLLADLSRVRHLLTVDSSMSAVRQLGNRLAYEQLLHELRQAADGPRVLDHVPDPVRQDDRFTPVAIPAPASASYSRASATVETIDFRWHR